MTASRHLDILRFTIRCALAASLLLISSQSPALAGPGPSDAPSTAGTDLDYAQVKHVDVIQSTDGTWCIYTTVRHHDEGVGHYANAWQALDQDGNEVAWRLLAHPHVYEQPFERDECRVSVPSSVTALVVRARCNVHGFGSVHVEVDMSTPAGENFTVVRKK
jgi:desulfoferrodoxin (superoxide reductase-like protein)